MSHHRLLANMPAREYLETLGIRTLGNFLIISSLFLMAKTVYQPVYEEVRFFMNDITKKSYVVSGTTPAPQETPEAGQSGRFAQLFQQNNVEVLVPEDPEFSLVIPKIGANAKVVKNVNAASEQEYLDALKDGIAHARGTGFPGEGGHIFLFAHSTDYIWNIGSYNAVFYLLYKLEIGDEINMFYEGQRYAYEVKEKVIIEPTDVEYLTRRTDYELLTLQTCWPPGTTLKRLIIGAERKVE